MVTKAMTTSFVFVALFVITIIDIFVKIILMDK